MPLYIDRTVFILAVLTIILFALPAISILLLLSYKYTKKHPVLIFHIIISFLSLSLLAASTLLPSIYWNKTVDRLEKSNSFTEGIIITNTPSPNGHGACSISYKYTIENSKGKEKTFKQGYDMYCPEAPKVGATVTVLYDKNNPILSTIERRLHKAYLTEEWGIFYLIAMLLYGGIIVGSTYLDWKKLSRK